MGYTLEAGGEHLSEEEQEIIDMWQDMTPKARAEFGNSFDRFKNFMLTSSAESMGGDSGIDADFTG